MKMYILQGPHHPQIQHRLVLGDALDPDALDTATAGEPIRAVVTDPPYSSGGRTVGERQAAPELKYPSSDTRRSYVTFPGDNADQRSWTRWAALWLGALHDRADDRAYCMAFSDWRQLPALTDAMQAAGWLWRGINVWDKTRGSRAPGPAFFRHQAEYIPWASRGKLPRITAKGSGVMSGVFTHSTPSASKRFHMTQKPIEVLEWLLSILREPGVVVDPFVGSGTTILAADRVGRPCAALERSPQILDLCLQRLTGEGFRVQEERAA